MESSINEAYILHDKKITTLAQLARNLNPLSTNDFEKHRNDIMKWVLHIFHDEVLHSRLQKTESKDDFIRLLMLRHDHEKAKNLSEPVKEEKILKNHQVKKILENEMPNIIREPKKFASPHEIKKPEIEYEFNDFMHLVFEARKDLEVKEFDEGIKKYEQLKNLFENANLTDDHKKRLHAEIKYIFEEIKNNLS